MSVIQQGTVEGGMSKKGEKEQLERDGWDEIGAEELNVEKEKRGINQGIQERTTNTRGYFKGHMKIYYC